MYFFRSLLEGAPYVPGGGLLCPGGAPMSWGVPPGSRRAPPVTGVTSAGSWEGPLGRERKKHLNFRHINFFVYFLNIFYIFLGSKIDK